MKDLSVAAHLPPRNNATAISTIAVTDEAILLWGYLTEGMSLMEATVIYGS